MVLVVVCDVCVMCDVILLNKIDRVVIVCVPCVVE